MARAIGKTGLVSVAVGIAVYVLILLAQGQAAANLCNNYPAGSRIDDLGKLEGTFLLTQMGPLEDPGKPGAQKIIFCASLTMCDTSCSLEIEDRVVKSARFSDY